MTLYNPIIKKKIGIEFEFKSSMVSYLRNLLEEDLIAPYNAPNNTPTIRNNAVTRVDLTTPAMKFEFKAGVYKALKLINDVLLSSTSVTVEDKNNISSLVSLVSRYVGMEGEDGYHFMVATFRVAEAISKAINDGEVSPYCTSSFSNLPVTFPPYGCETNVNTTGIENLNNAWKDCESIVNFPCINTNQVTTLVSTWENCTSLQTFPNINTSNVTNFSYSWYNCTSLQSLPLIDTSSGTLFTYTWSYSGITSFPLLDVSRGTLFNQTWHGCTSLTTFPAGMFDNCEATNFQDAWTGCALSQTSVDNILVSLDTSGVSGGIVGLGGGTSSPPGAAGSAAVANLLAKGWTVFTN